MLDGSRHALAAHTDALLHVAPPTPPHATTLASAPTDSQLRGAPPGGGYAAAAAAAAAAGAAAGRAGGGGGGGALQAAPAPAPSSLAGGRVAVGYKDDTLRAVVERLAAPGVRRLIIVDRATRRVQGVVSLSDVAAYLFL
jgi:hypothetical protein